MDEIWQAVLREIIPVVVIVAKGVAAAAVVGALAQLSVERLLAPVALNTPVLPTSWGGEVGKRLAVLFAAQGAVVAAHGLDIYTFGSGPKGYGAALFFGFLGGAVTPAVHNAIKARAAADKP